MGTVKNISDLTDLSAYRSYSIVPFSGNVTVKTYSSSGYVDYDFCDVYMDEVCSLICFRQPLVNSPANHNFVVANEDFNFVVQNSMYENNIDVLSGERLYPYSFYVYLNSVNMTPSAGDDAGVKDAIHYQKGKGNFSRCDYESWGPLTFYDLQSGYNIIQIRTLFSLSGTAHIIRMDVADTEIKNTSSRAGNTAARSLRGIFKTIHEWSIVANEPFNNAELPSLRATPFLTGLGLSEPVLTELISGSPEMRVAQYLRGTTTAYGVTEENFTVPESFQNWIRSVMMYSTVSGVVKNNPYGQSLNISPTIIASEKQQIENQLFSFMMNNGIDPSLVNIKNITEVAQRVIGDTTPISKTEFIRLFRSFSAYQ